MTPSSVATVPVPVVVEKLSYAYGDRVALNEVGFAVRPGEIFGLLGPNGSGKTTLFRILSTLVAPPSGTVRLFGGDVTGDPQAVRRRLGVVFQHPSVDRKLTVAENLRHQGHLYGLGGHELRSRVDDMLDRFDLADRRNDLVEKLSGGLQRRVELAKGLLHHPDLLILDEPSTGLDPGARRTVWDYLGRLRDRDGVTVLLTTHFFDEAERCDRLGILNEGALVALGTPAELKSEIGADVIVIETGDPEQLRDHIRATLRTEPKIMDGMIRIYERHNEEWVSKFMKTSPIPVESVTVRKPTLEDVFMRRTGHRFYMENP